MQINLITVGKGMPKWIIEGYQEYAKRLPSECHLQLTEIPAGKRGKNADLTRLIEQEGRAMAAAVTPQSHIIALDVLGKNWSTEQLAEKIKTWQFSGNNVSLLVGGPEGLAENCLALAHEKWSLSALTFPHPLVRVIVAEQIYRAWSLLRGHPYHRA